MTERDGKENSVQTVLIFVVSKTFQNTFVLFIRSVLLISIDLSVYKPPTRIFVKFVITISFICDVKSEIKKYVV